MLPVLDITRMHNVGAAFSFLAPASGWQRWLFIGLAVVVSIGIIVWLLAMPRGTIGCSRRASRWCSAARSAMSSIASAWGMSIDFIHFHWDRAYFPAFNVADSAITVGAACLLLDALFDRRAEQGET